MRSLSRFATGLAMAHVLMSAAGAEGGEGGGAGVDPAPESTKAPGVGDVAKALIREGKTNEEVLAAIKAQFPEAKTSMASVNWYRNKLRTDGEKVPTARELKAGEKAEKDRLKAEAKQAEKDKKAQEKKDKKAEKDRLKQEEKDRKAAEKAAAANKGGEADKGGEEGGNGKGDGNFLD